MRSAAAARGEGSLRASGGIRLHYHTWEVGEARAAIVVVHGLSEHGGRYDELGQMLGAMDISTFALDLRGHGQSDGRRGHVASFGQYLQDLDRFRREVLGLVDPDTPIFLLGHSMGGLIALRYQEEYPGMFAGAIVVSPWLASAMPIPRWKSTLASTLARVLPALPFTANIPAENLSHHPGIVAAYRNDPLIHDRITPRLFVEASREMGMAFQRSDRITAPLLLMLAGSDRIVDTERSLRFARSLAGPTVAIKVYDDLFHEVLNEPADEPLRDLRGWLSERLH
jgi:lysophospholipase